MYKNCNIINIYTAFHKISMFVYTKLFDDNSTITKQFPFYHNNQYNVIKLNLVDNVLRLVCFVQTISHKKNSILIRVIAITYNTSSK